MSIRFSFRWWPFIAASIAVAVGVSLGQWQMRRAAEKEAVESKLSVRERAPALRIDGGTLAVDELEYRRVLVRGEFVPNWTLYLDNRPHKGVAGFHVLMPLKIAGSDRHVLVARGWTPRDVVDRTRLPAIATPAGVVEIEGRARRASGKVLQLGTAPPLKPGAIVQNAEIAEFAVASKLAMQPLLIELTSDLQDGLVRDWPRPSSGVDKHLGYAFQWYALAATALVFFIVTGLRRKTQQHHA